MELKAAISQQVIAGKPKGFSALHILCNGSGVGTYAASIIRQLIDNGDVPLQAFASWKNNAVGVLFPGSAYARLPSVR